MQIFHTEDIPMSSANTCPPPSTPTLVFTLRHVLRKRNEIEIILADAMSTITMHGIWLPIKPWHYQKQIAQTRPPDQTLVESKGKASGFPEMWRAGCMEQWMPTVSMVATNVVIAIMTALIKQALNQGMNRLVLITFRQMVATVFLGPIAYFKERYQSKSITIIIKYCQLLVACILLLLITDFSGRQDQSSQLKSLSTCS
jgi:hypothetical protein